VFALEFVMPFAPRPLVLTTLSLGLGLSGCSGAAGAAGGDVASVNGTAITRSDFDAKMESSPTAKQVLNQLVQGALIDKYAKDNNIAVADADIDKEENDIKSKYPPGQFEQILKQQGLSENDVRTILRQKIVVDKAVGANVHISDADVKNYLAKNHATLDTAEQVRARHILVPSPQTAQLVESKLKSGGDFAALAKQYSTDPSSKDKGGELGFFGKGQMVPAFQEAAFSQPLNKVGKAVKSPFGYHIIEVEERKLAQIATLANSRDKITTTLKTQQEQTQIPTFLQGLRSKADIKIYDDRLKDALPPVPGAQATGGAPAAGAAPAASPK